MVAGSKEFLLFPPEQQFNLYTAPQKLDAPWRSLVDPKHPDLERHPGFAVAMAAAQTIRVEAGDVLFVPAGWWHGVDSFGFNVMFNARWYDVDQAIFDAGCSSFAHAVLAARRLAPSHAAAFRAELRRHAFSRAAGPLQPAQREQWLAQLRDNVSPIADDASPLTWDDPLVIGPTVRASLASEGVALCDEVHGDSFMLAWDLVPMLQRFTSPTSATDALCDLQREFDLEPQTLWASVTELHAHGVLVRPSRGADDEVAAQRMADAALAHVVLATAELPRHHRDTIERRIDTYGFAVHGDPYPGIGPDEQGAFGWPMNERRVQVLEEMVRRSLHDHHGISMLPGDFWRTRYMLHPGRSCAIARGGLGFTDPVSKSRKNLRWEHLEVLAHFRAPSSPADVFAQVREAWTTTAEDFQALAASWVVCGALVEARA
jgi:hypothetical protein